MAKIKKEWHPNDDLPQTLQEEVMNLRRRMKCIDNHAKDMFKDMDKFQDWLGEKYDHGVPATLWGHLLGITLGAEEVKDCDCEPFYEEKVTGYCSEPFPEGYKFPSQREVTL